MLGMWTDGGGSVALEKKFGWKGLCGSEVEPA